MERVCHVTSVHKRYDVRIFEKECVSLAKNGYEVHLIVNDNLPSEVIDGVHIHSTGFLPQTRKERIRKSMPLIWSLINSINAEVYHFHDPELIPVMLKVKRSGNKVIFDAHEDTQQQILDKEWIPIILRKMVSDMYGIYERTKLKKCDCIITVTPQIVSKMQTINNNVGMVTNYPIIENLSEEAEVQSDKNYIFFAGGISTQWCHREIIEAISDLKDIRYRLAGPHDEEYFAELKRLEGWNKVDYLGLIQHQQVSGEYSGAIAGMAINRCSQLGENGTLGNTKLFEIMAAGKPVICTNYKLWKEVVEEKQCGICVDSNNVDEIRGAIEYLLIHPEQAKQMGRNGRKAIQEEYNWLTQEKVLLDVYKGIM